ncbi:hypothetical protein ACIGFK_19470 [Streptomyces sp. NPDC085524]|uniref:hypothetical protein n=1 Tax=Streptomyces sp. NPDC085524 TaxID=3365728 RepID=UPI0037D90D08
MQPYRNIWLRQRIPFGKETADVLVAWAMDADEEDPPILVEVLQALGRLKHPELESVGLRHAGHPSPDVRVRVPDLVFDWRAFHLPPGPAEDALLRLATDEDPRVRSKAGGQLVFGDDGSSEFTDALVSQGVRGHGAEGDRRVRPVHGLARCRDGGK